MEPREPPPVDDGAPQSTEEILESVRRISQENERLFSRLLTGERRFRRLAKAVWQVQENERGRLARELHDGIGQTLTALKMRLELLASAAGDGGAEKLGDGLAEAVELAGMALSETRELSRLLRPKVLDDLGLAPALSWLRRTLGQSTGIEIALEVSDLEGARLDPAVETLIFRVVQEALTNVVKHAEAQRAEVAVTRRGDRVEVRIADAGIGFEVTEVEEDHGASGHGLRGIRDRVELFDGELVVTSAPGQGTAIEVRLRLPQEGG